MPRGIYLYTSASRVPDALRSAGQHSLHSEQGTGASRAGASEEGRRPHRAASEGALRHYAVFASWELERRLESAAEHALAPVLLRFRFECDAAGRVAAVMVEQAGDPALQSPRSGA